MPPLDCVKWVGYLCYTENEVRPNKAVSCSGRKKACAFVKLAFFLYFIVLHLVKHEKSCTVYELIGINYLH